MRFRPHKLSKTYFNLSLRNKFIIPTIAVVFISFLSVGIYFIHNHRSNQEIRLQEKAKRISRLLLSSNLESIWDVDLKNLERNCQAFFEDEEITRIVIIDTIYGEDELINLSKEIKGTQDIVKKADFVMGDRKIAKLEVVFSNYYIEQYLAQLRNTLVFLSVLLFILMAGLINIVSQIALTPLKGMMKGVEHLTTRDLKFRIPLQSQDELGKLAVSYNTMAEELNLHHDHLQELVEQRTDELRQSREKYRNLYEEAKKTEELYHSLLDSTPDAIVMYDIDGSTLYINDAFTNKFGWNLDELRDGVPYVPDSEKEISGIKVKKVIQDGIPVSHFETKRLTKDGQLVDVSISASRFNDHEDNPAGMLVILRDITEHKQAEEELRTYSETQEVLLQEVNHRVKNNLSAIIGMLYKEEDRAKAEGMTYYLDVIGDLQGRIEGLSTVHSLLSASSWRPLLLSQLCEQVINATLQGVPLDTKILMKIKDSPVRVNSNQAHHLTLVINELATNTLKHALADRDSVRIGVDILLENDNVHIVFCDDGSGYPKEMIEGDFSRANVGFDLINGIVGESLRGRVILKNENGAITSIVFKHDSVED